jgi:prevent-host-death family protein
MVTYERKSPRVWTVAEAKSRLSEVLRRAEDEGPQRIGTRKESVVVPAGVWDERNEPGQSLGRWLLAHAPRIGALKLPTRDDSEEPPGPFDDWTKDDWEAFDRKRLDRETP